jgi:polyphosphate:AMP phosphotransferase
LFEIAELGRKIEKDEYKQIVPELRTELLAVQRALAEADFPVLILLNGVEGAGKGEALNLLYDWMDARYMEAHALGEPTPHQAEFPEYWRFWMSLPSRGRIGVYIGNWYTQPILHRVFGETTEAAFESQLERVNRFEQELIADGALILKFWFHLGKDAQKRRLKRLSKDPETAWRVTKKDKSYFKLYDAFRSVSERAIVHTSTGEAQWIVVEGSDWRYRNVEMGRRILSSIKSHMERRKVGKEPRSVEPPRPDPMTILDQLDLSNALPRKTYDKQLEHWQGVLARRARQAYEKKVSAIFMFEGWDAAGKGGAIRRLIHPLDARQFRVIPIAAPTDEELAHHYLWRFWRQLPPRGNITIYDRSWYGRVLVERIEGFATVEERRRSYREIRDFEEQLYEHGIGLAKFWLHISQDEQLRRFKERETIPWKQHKITAEDYRNREKNHQYEVAADEMVGRTSTEYAPWTLVEAEDKKYGRIKVLETACRVLEETLDRAKK